MSTKNMNKHPRVDAFLKASKQWREEFEELRSVALECPLTEELKWRHPCYTLGSANIVLIHGFKEYCALLFFKGALLKDPKGILIQQTKNTQAARQLRFTSVAEIRKQRSTIKEYILQAVEVEKAGMEVEFKETSKFEIPEEFQKQLRANRALKKAFETLTPGRQRAYLLHFSGAKQSKTRESRIEKCTPRILAGKGLKDD